MKKGKNRIFEEQYSDKHTAKYFSGPFFYRLLRQFEEDRISKVASLIKGDNLDLLEIGFASGRFLDESLTKWRSITGVDIVDDWIKKARRKKYNVPIKFLKYDFGFEKMPFSNNSFDLVVMISTLQFMYDIDLVFKQLKRVLRPNGRIIIEVPNVAVIWRRIQIFFGQFPKTSNFSNAYDGGTIHYFTERGFKEFIKKYGFEVEKVSCSGIFSNLREFYPSLLGGDLIFICKAKR